MRKLKNSKLNPRAGRYNGQAADDAAIRAQDRDVALAGAADSPLGDGTTPVDFDSRESAKRRIQEG